MVNGRGALTIHHSPFTIYPNKFARRNSHGQPLSSVEFLDRAQTSLPSCAARSRRSLNLFLLLQIPFVVVPRDHYFSEVIASGFCRYLRHPTVDDYLQRVNVRFGKLYAEALRGREIPCLLSV